MDALPYQVARSWNLEHRKDIQGLRAIAVTAVVCFHAGMPLGGGFTGVDIFFVISGFVITLMLTREWQRHGSLNLPRFYFRRFKRLMPALSLLVSTIIGLSTFFLSPLGQQAKVAALTGIGAISMTANLTIAKHTGGYFDVAATDNPLLNIWSLSVEEQFYVLFPAALFAAFAVTRSSGWRLVVPATVVLLGIISLAAALVGSSATDLSPRVSHLLGFYSPITRAWEFASGAALALARAHAPRSKFMVSVLAWGGLILTGLSFVLISGKTPFPGPMTLLPVLGAIALILAGSSHGHVSFLSRTLGAKPFVYVGDISYSWYLWHWPIIVFTSMAISPSPVILTIAAAISLLPAIASYEWVESPLRRLGPMGRIRALRFLVLTLLPPIAICAAFIFSNSKGYWLSDIKAFRENVDPLHAANVAGCGEGRIPSLSDSDCLWNANGHGLPIYLIGDSNADHLSEAVIGAAQGIGSPVRIITKGGCAFVGRSWSNRSDTEQVECLKFVDGTRALLQKAEPGIVILGLADSGWWRHGFGVGTSRQTETTDVQAIRRYLKAELIATAMQVRQRGHRVLFVLPVPKYVTQDGGTLFDPQKCPTISVLSGHCPKEVIVTTAFEDDLQHDARDAMTTAAHATGSEILDLRRALCHGNHCSNMSSDERLLYRDAGHLTVSGSASLSPLFFGKISSMISRR